MTMTPRENFFAAFNQGKPERILVDMGKQVGSLHKGAYVRLREHLGNVPMHNQDRILDRMAQNVFADEPLLERLGVDFRWLVPHWVQVRERTDVNGYIDMWGVPFRGTANGEHYAVDGAPLKKATLADLQTYAWPDTEDPAQFAGLREQAKHWYENTGYVIGADGIKAGPLMTALQMRGYEQFFMDLVIDTDFADALLEGITSRLKRMWTRFLEEVGPYVQVAFVTDDLGTQTSLLMSPDLFRERIKPWMKELHDHIKSLADVKIIMHSDGAVVPLIDDLIGINVDILNPVQTSVRGLEDTQALKDRFGDRIGFHGAIDVQQLMPNATVQEMRWEVARRVHDLGRSGCFILSPCHNIGPDIPPQNVVALYDFAREFGRHPLQLDAEIAADNSYFARHP